MALVITASLKRRPRSSATWRSSLGTFSALAAVAAVGQPPMPKGMPRAQAQVQVELALELGTRRFGGARSEVVRPIVSGGPLNAHEIRLALEGGRVGAEVGLGGDDGEGRHPGDKR